MQYGGEDHLQLSRTLGNFAKHPNFGAYLLVGLGCETAQGSFLVEREGLVQIALPGKGAGDTPLLLTIQDEGGVRKTIERGIEVLKELLPRANEVRREPIPLSELILGTNCGGSDGNSGVTANPALGVASDRLVAAGGTSVLAETTEIYGGEHTLTRRAISREVGERLIERIRWWERHTAMFGVTINNNPSVGNKKGGLTTIYEKSLGAIAKGGTTALRGVFHYAEPITEKGFVIMDTPGYDPVSVTGLVAGGSNIVVFTTGAGELLRLQAGPVDQGRHEHAHVRADAGRHGHQRRRDSGRRIGRGGGSPNLRQDRGGGERRETKSEAQGIGDEEFAPWQIGPTL